MLVFTFETEGGIVSRISLHNVCAIDVVTNNAWEIKGPSITALKAQSSWSNIFVHLVSGASPTLLSDNTTFVANLAGPNVLSICIVRTPITGLSKFPRVAAAHTGT